MSRHHAFLLCALPALSTILLASNGDTPPVYLTQWGSAGSGDGEFNEAQGVATDSAGNVYVADGYNSRIQKFTSTGTYLTQWGSFGSGNGQFSYPWAVATDSAGNVYVADQQNNRIQKFTSTGTYITQWGGFFWPRGVATDAAGDVYVADTFDFRIQKFTGTGTYLTQWGSFGSGNGEFYSPLAVATGAGGSVYVAEGEGPNQRVQAFTNTGTYLSQWSAGGGGPFYDPYGIGTDPAGNVYVADCRHHRIQKFSGTGTYLTQWGSVGSGDGEFAYPVSVATDAAGDIYVVDQGNSRIQKFGPAVTPCVTFDFETEDDLVTPLGNGQSLTTPPEFGVLVSIASAGSNLGVTTFDSTPGGPNSGTADADMLIDKGNLLMLQDSARPTQSVPGFFDVPVDDPDGGDLVFRFTTPAEPGSVALIDLDPLPNAGASVILTDEGGATRTYTIPPGWTGSFSSVPGWKALSLATLANQVGNAPGFRIATASETPGYLPDRVETLVVHLTGLGAIDDLSVCFPNPQRASVTTRNGSGANPTILRSGSRPVLGSHWSAELDCASYGSGLATLVMRRRASSGTMTPFGELLVVGALVVSETRTVSTTASTFAWQIPNDLSLLGLDLHVQGACQETTAAPTGKVRRVRMGLSNALDLIVGF